MKPKFFRSIASALSLITFTGAAHAAVITKADNTSELGQAASWNGAVPGAADTASWAGAYNTAGSLAAALPASTLDWQGISVGFISGSAAGPVLIGGAGTPAAGAVLNLGAAGISLAGANQDLVINAATLGAAASQSWTVPSGRSLRLGSGPATGKLSADDAATVITVTGGGTVDANQSSAGFGGYKGKWVVGPDTVLSGVGTGSGAWGTNTAEDAITLDGGTLAFAGDAATAIWPSPIMLESGRTSTIANLASGAGIGDLTLSGVIDGYGTLDITKSVGKRFILRLNNPDNLWSGGARISSAGSYPMRIYGYYGTSGGYRSPLGVGDISITGSPEADVTLEFTTTATNAESADEFIIDNPFNLTNARLETREGSAVFTGTIHLTGANSIHGNVARRDITLEGLLDGPGSVQLKTVANQRIHLPYSNFHSGGTILGTGSANSGSVTIGDPDALGSGPVTASGAQIQSPELELILPNPFTLTNGGLSFSGDTDFILEKTVTVADNAARPLQNTGGGTLTLAGVALTGGDKAAVTFGGSPNSPIEVGGPITGPGKITVSSGLVELQSANTFTGGTTVSGSGRLELTGSLASDLTLAGKTASLNGSGTIHGTLITNGASGAGVVPLDPENPHRAITATNVELKGPTAVQITGPLPEGETTYTVVKYTNSLTISGNGAWVSPAVRGSFTHNTATKTVLFTASPATRTWTGNEDAKWNTSSLNWAEGDQLFASGDSTLFGDDGAGTLEISGVVAPSLATFNNTEGNDYVLISKVAHQIGGAARLTVNCGGRVTLAGPNSFTGQITVNSGVLAFYSDASLGAAPPAPQEEQIILAGGTLMFTPDNVVDLTIHANRGISIMPGTSTLDTSAQGNTNTATVAGEISGDGDLVILSNGSTSLTGDGVNGSTLLRGPGFRTGNTIIKAGVVAMESGFGGPDATVILDGGGIVDRNLNLTFSQPLQAGPEGGILRSYQSATTNITSDFSNHPLAPYGVFTHTDGGVQIFSGDASALTGSYINATGSATFESEDWSGVDFVNVDGVSLTFRNPDPYGDPLTITINSLITDRDVHIGEATILDVKSGLVTVAPGTASQNFWFQDYGSITSSSGTLTFDFQTPFTATGANDQAVRVLVEDPDAHTPLTVVKKGPGSLARFDQPNIHSGGTIIEEGRIDAADSLCLGYGPVTVHPGAQLFLSHSGYSYYNDAVIEGLGPEEAAGNLGALRFGGGILDGELTISPQGARIGALSGAEGGVEGYIVGTGPLEINSPAAGHGGAISLMADGSAYTGPITVSRGTLLLDGSTGGDVTLAPAGAIGGTGEIAGTLSFGGGSGLLVAGDDPDSPGAATLITGERVLVRLESLPEDPQEPITLIRYGTLNGALEAFDNAPDTIARLAFSDTGSAIVAVLDNGTRTWTGAESGVWDSDALNWAEGDMRFLPGDSALFTDDAETKLVTISGQVRPAQVTVSNSTGNDYIISGGFTTPTEGNLTKTGSGTLTLQDAPPSIGGEIHIEGGRLVFDGTERIRGAGPDCTGITIHDGGVFRVNVTNSLYDGAGGTPITVNQGGAVELNAYHNHFKEVTLNGGTIIGLTPDGDGTRHNNEYAVFDLPVIVGGAARSVITRQAGTTGVFALIAGVAFEVEDAAAGTDLLISAPLNGAGFIKNGPGTMELTQSGNISGALTVNAGTLLVSNRGGSATGASAVTVKSGASFGGGGAITGALTLESGATLTPGAPVSTLATGTLTLPAGATLKAEINSEAALCDTVAVSGNATIGGTLNLSDVAASPRVIPGGVKLTLMSYTGSLSGTFSGRAEGSTVNIGPNSFKLSYNDGKKITLESLAAVAPGYDAWAAANITNGRTGRSQDADGDGFTNLQEFLFGTDPMAATGSLTTSETSGGKLILRWLQRGSGVSYQIKESLNLSPGSWLNSPLPNKTDPNQAGSPAGYERHLAEIPLGEAPAKFYRIEATEK